MHYLSKRGMLDYIDNQIQGYRDYMNHCEVEGNKREFLGRICSLQALKKDIETDLFTVHSDNKPYLYKEAEGG